MIRYYTLKENELSDRLLAYQQAVLDIAAYNSALLLTSAPSDMGVEGEDGKKADACYWSVRENGKDWAEVIVPHCCSVPQTILGFSFSSYMEIAQQSLELLAEDPKNKDIRQNLSAMFEEAAEVMRSCAKDTQTLNGQIAVYCENIRQNIDDFQTILDAVAAQIQADETKKEEIRQNIQEAQKKVSQASARLSADEKLLSNKWFILISIVALGIPLIIVEIDEKTAATTVENERKKLTAYENRLSDEERLLGLLYGAGKTYADLKENTKTLQTASEKVADIWKEVATACTSYAELLLNEKSLCDQAELESLRKEIKTMTAGWEALQALAKPLSTFTYAVQVTADQAA